MLTLKDKILLMNACVITGDVVGFTRIPVAGRKKLILQSSDLLVSWTGDPAFANIFRGDSFQALFNDIGTALRRSIQLRCWFRMHSISEMALLDARMVIGVGGISYFGKNILESDGEAFHLSGRAFDKLEEGEYLQVVTPDASKNEQLKMILDLAEVIMGNWTISQAEVIYHLLEGKTQHEMAAELHIGQSAVNSRIKLARWKQIDKMNNYIESLIGRL